MPTFSIWGTHYLINCETQPPAFIGWLALSSVVRSFVVCPASVTSPLVSISSVAELSPVYCCLVFFQLTLIKPVALYRLHNAHDFIQRQNKMREIIRNCRPSSHSLPALGSWGKSQIWNFQDLFLTEGRVWEIFKIFFSPKEEFEKTTLLNLWSGQPWHKSETG